VIVVRKLQRLVIQIKFTLLYINYDVDLVLIILIIINIKYYATN